MRFGSGSKSSDPHDGGHYFREERLSEGCVFLQGYITATVVAFPLLFKETQSRPGATLSHMYSNKIGLELTVGERTGPHKIPLRATRSALERLVRRNGPPDVPT